VTIHLSILIFWPLALALLGAVLAPGRFAALFALLGAAVPFAYAVVALLDYDTARGGLQYVTDDAWIRELGIHYKLGLDGLNLWLVGLATLLFLVSTLWLLLRPPVRPKLFAVHFGIAEAAVLGALMAQDLALFVLFFDLMLVPFYFLVGQWGGPGRVAAAVKMVIYTLVGSLLMLAGAVATAVLSARSGSDISFVLSDLQRNLLPESTQKWVFVAFALAFLIKMPAFPFHGWMPDAYGTMPLPALAVFSGVVSKVAAYGFLRLVLPLFPAPVHDWQTILLVLSLLSILYGSIQAFTQTSARLVLGYSSLAQLGFITLGIFALDPQATGAQGALLQAVNHGLVVAPMFFIVALLAERAGGSDDIRDMGGIAVRAPVLASLFLVATFATLAIPGSANFVGEFLILLGVFKTKVAIAIIASLGVVLASVYALRLYIRAMHNREGPTVGGRDLRLRDAAILVPLVAAIVAFALYPQQALRDGEPAVRTSVRSALAAGSLEAGAAQTAAAPSAAAARGATP
jgi:NADH-quinone oxidoreductase subunit M